MKTPRKVLILDHVPGLRRDRAFHPDVPIVTAALDEGLNALGYILSRAWGMPVTGPSEPEEPACGGNGALTLLA